MSRSYYYLAASLPLLDFDSKPPFSHEEFMENCQRLVSAQDFVLLLKTELHYCEDPVEKNATLNQWLRFSCGLRNELAWFRANELNRDPYDHMRGDRHTEPIIVDVMAQATQSLNPLDAEKALDRARWQKLDELLRGHYFDIEFLMVYSLKLQILERYQRINSSEGQNIFQQYQELARSHNSGRLNSYQGKGART